MNLIHKIFGKRIFCTEEEIKRPVKNQSIFQDVVTKLQWADP